jgi:Flp pilus assembly protein TadD
VHYAPYSATAVNTLGTVLSATGHVVEARRAYERALALDAHAAYALNNLCYLSFLEGDIASALSECQAALAVDPRLVPARNNLALAYAALQREDLALREFLAAGDAAVASYNIGIVHTAEGRYEVAAKAFDEASRERPSWGAARARARKTRALAAKAGSPVQ